MNAWTLAARNLRRNGRRSLTTLIAIVLGTCAILLFGGYNRYIQLSIQTEVVAKGGHLQLQRKGFYLNGSGSPETFGFSNYAHLIDVVRQDPELGPMIKVITPTLQFGGIAGNFAAEVSRNVLGTGMVAEDADALRRWNDYGFALTASRPASLTGTESDSIIVGRGLAGRLQLCTLVPDHECQQQPKAPARSTADESMPSDIAALAGDAQSAGQQAPPASNQVEILSPNVYGAPNVVRAHVVAAQAQGVKELDDLTVLLHLKQAQQLIFGRQEPAATAIVIQLQHTSQTPLAKARLETLLANELKNEPLEALDFETLNPLYGQTINMFDAIFGFMAILMSVIVLFTIGNTMSMAVVERTVEVGTLRAMGLRAGGIQRIFVCEGAVLGAFGALLGLSAALLIAYTVNHSGFTWVPPGRAEPVSLGIWVWGDPALVIKTVVGLAGIAVLSAWTPARRAAKLNVVDALRHV
jgi:putative ABC transport system permease protein